MAEPELYPIILERRLDTRIWGGSRMGAWLGLEHPPAQLAESWQVYDENVVLNGPLAGMPLARVAQQYGVALVGTRSFAHYGASVPLLAKFIDAADSLSVQVHPDDAYARAHAAATGFSGKTEAWYILAAQPGANLIYGLNHPVSREELASAIREDRLLDLLNRMPVVAGDVVFVPAGTIHAIEPGIMLFEIQQKSDLTYRLYDYNRRDAQGQPRELHIAQALEVSDLRGEPLPRALPLPLDEGQTRMLLLACPFFALERLWVANRLDTATDPASFEIITAIEGQGLLDWAGGTMRLARGQSLLLPARLGSYRLQPEPGLELLRCTIPDLDALQALLRVRGVPESDIRRTIHRET